MTRICLNNSVPFAKKSLASFIVGCYIGELNFSYLLAALAELEQICRKAAQGEKNV